MISVLLGARSWMRVAVATGAALGLCMLPASAYAAPVQPSTYGLYGSQDPTYDGAFRQSLAILALGASGEPVPGAAVDWLTHQQCADGGWTAYRKNVEQPCDAGAEDSNSTAMAVQALASVGGASGQVDRGVDWLIGQQNRDGGIGAKPGSRTDANSTSLFIQALLAAGRDPASSTSSNGKTPQDALLGLQVGCVVGVTTGGGFTFQGGKKQQTGNTLATVAAVFALSGQVLPVTAPGSSKPKAPSCSNEATTTAGDAAATGAYYLSHILRDHSWRVPALQGKGTDWGTTANAVVALAAVGATKDAHKAMAALAKHANGYVKAQGEDLPGALANVVLAAVATGRDPHQVAGNAVHRLVATGVNGDTGGSTPSAAPTAMPSATPLSSGAGDDGGSTPWIPFIVIGVVVAIAIGVLVGRSNGTDSRQGGGNSEDGSPAS